MSSRTQLSQKSREIRSILSKILVIVGVENCCSLIGEDQSLGISLTVSIVLRSANDGPVGRLMDERSGPGIGTDGAGRPEGTAEVDLSECRGVYEEFCW